MNTIGLHRWEVNIGSSNGLVLPGNKPLPESLLMKFRVIVKQGEITKPSNKFQPGLWHIEAETGWPPFRRRHFNRIYWNDNVRISIKISLKFVPKGPINNNPSLVQIMAWRRSGDKPLSEPMMVSLLTHICVTQPQWVNILHLIIGGLLAINQTTDNTISQ